MPNMPKMPKRRNTTYSNRPSHAARAAHARGDKKFRTFDTSYIQPKKSKAPSVIAGVVAIAIIVAIVVFAITQIASCAGNNLVAEGAQVNVIINEGEGGNEIADKLVEAGLIADTSDFKNALSSKGQSSNLKAGSYVLVGGASAESIVDTLVAGPPATKITIPEGNTLTTISNTVASTTKEDISASEFKNQADKVDEYRSSYSFIDNASSLEGFLFPKTYPLTNNTTADSLIRTMLDQYNTETASLNYSYPESKGLSKYDVLKLASIIEKESDETTREKVSAVFYNRLFNSTDTDEKTGFGYLQSDATTAYCVGHDPTAEEVHANNEYSTYTNSGLPPTPICNPGIESLQAACNPDQQMIDDGYYFFYFAKGADGNMKYYFSKTLDEHNAAIAENS